MLLEEIFFVFARRIAFVRTCVYDPGKIGCTCSVVVAMCVSVHRLSRTRSLRAFTRFFLLLLFNNSRCERIMDYLCLAWVLNFERRVTEAFSFPLQVSQVADSLSLWSIFSI